jgi:hypothetical protein
MILYIKTQPQKKKTIRTNKWIQESCRIQNQHSKPVTQLYADRELSETEMKKAIPFTIATKIPMNKFKQRDKRSL